MYVLKWNAVKLCNKLSHRKYAFKKYLGQRILSAEEGNDLLKEAIQNGEPFMAGRFGATELNTMVKFENSSKQHSQKQNAALQQLGTWSGFFPLDYDSAHKFVDIMEQAIESIDLIGVWFNPMEDYIIGQYEKTIPKTCMLESLEPYYFEQPWTSALRGKKVLVIHPFAKEIESQYEKREKLFPNKTDVLPEFELTTIKAVQTIAGEKDERFASWFDALDYMYKEAMKCDFDVAIIGCGAYGFPLAARLKQAGKITVHMGGALQILFGIRGSRWDNIPQFQALFNEYWVHPSPEDIPGKSKTVENGCYW